MLSVKQCILKFRNTPLYPGVTFVIFVLHVFVVVPFVCGHLSAFLAFVSRVVEVLLIFCWIFCWEVFLICCVEFPLRSREGAHWVSQWLGLGCEFFQVPTLFLLIWARFLDLGFPSPSKAPWLQWLLWDFIEAFFPLEHIFDKLCFILILLFSLKQSGFFFLNWKLFLR